MNINPILLVTGMALSGCSMNNTASESIEPQINQPKLDACRMLVAGVIAREQMQISQSGGVPADLLGITEVVQVQRDPNKPNELSVIKVVRRLDGKLYGSSMGNGIGAGDISGINPIVKKNAEMALGPASEDDRRSKPSASKIVPTCTYKKGEYSVEMASDFIRYRYMVITNGLSGS